MAGGRPTKYDAEVVALANDYADNFKDYGDVVPSIVGLCRHINRSKSIVYDWMKDKNKPEFSDICSKIQEGQEQGLINGGLAGGFAPSVTKMLLTKHGYSDKTETDITSGGEKLSAPTYTVVDK